MTEVESGTRDERQLLRNHQAGRQDDHKLLFRLVMLEQWLRGTRSAQMHLTAR